MYVKDMTMRQAQTTLVELRQLDAETGHASNAIAWDIEDVVGRIDELTDWY